MCIRDSDELAARWESGLRGLVEAAAPGSDHQLALVRAYASTAESDDAVGYVRGLLEGISLEGLAVDTDLRWTLVTGLARAGVPVSYTHLTLPTILRV